MIWARAARFTIDRSIATAGICSAPFNKATSAAAASCSVSRVGVALRPRADGDMGLSAFAMVAHSTVVEGQVPAGGSSHRPGPLTRALGGPQSPPVGGDRQAFGGGEQPGDARGRDARGNA